MAKLIRKAKSETHHYSGDASARFWHRINRLPADIRDAGYGMGLILQEVEERVLQFLNEQEKKGKD